MNAPQVVDDITTINGAPFTLFVTDTVVLDTEELRDLIPDLI